MNDGISTEHLALLIPILFVLSCCLFATAYLLLRYLRRRRLFDLYHEERMAAIAKGVEVPSIPEAFLHEGGRMKPQSSGLALLKGLIWLFIGIGLFVAMRAENRDEGLFALVPIGVGLAYLIYYWVEGRRTVAPVSDHSEPSGPLPLPAKI